MKMLLAPKIDRYLHARVHPQAALTKIVATAAVPIK